MSEIDPTVSTFLNLQTVEIMAYVIADLEMRVIERKHVFRTQWANDLFEELSSRIKLTEGRERESIDNWFIGIINNNKLPTRGVNPSLTGADVSIPWVKYLTEREIALPGSLLLMHNIMKIENESRTHLKDMGAATQQYTFDKQDYTNRLTSRSGDSKLLL